MKEEVALGLAHVSDCSRRFQTGCYRLGSPAVSLAVLELQEMGFMCVLRRRCFCVLSFLTAVDSASITHMNYLPEKQERACSCHGGSLAWQEGVQGNQRTPGDTHDARQSHNTITRWEADRRNSCPGSFPPVAAAAFFYFSRVYFLQPPHCSPNCFRLSFCCSSFSLQIFGNSFCHFHLSCR